MKQEISDLKLEIADLHAELKDMERSNAEVSSSNPAQKQTWRSATAKKVSAWRFFVRDCMRPDI